jgi:hydrogenase maturation protein HypF
MKPERYRVKINGIVQGVGFRPFVAGLARSLFLSGTVSNTGDGVLIEAEGRADRLAVFLERLRSEAPPLSAIKDITVEKLDFFGYDGFNIIASNGKARNTMISPDISICADCAAELFDKSDPRYLYPFINCTNCGPRFTIIRDVPYDRPNTTMDGFAMCEDCRKQYEDPEDRRYHAQPVSCVRCGPGLRLLDKYGNAVEAEDIPGLAGKLLADGRILAIKGLGGYHLACDASDPEAVRELRRRKHRDERPFALMARDMDVVRACCSVDAAEEKLLESVKKPIVLLKKRRACRLPEEIAPGNGCLGMMLPYTPLHLLLFRRDKENLTACPGLLVMTSGNRSSEPICYTDESALRELGGIADYFLTHNRDIYIRTDDSVTRIFRGSEYLIRRSRGYAPMPLLIGGAVLPDVRPPVLACGGGLKNTFCLSRGDEFYISHHIGDLENLETMRSFEEGVGHFRKLFDIKPEITAYDLHPEYLSTRYALSQAEGVRIPVQHHHAHIASCMAENGLSGDVIGIAFDGTGYGEDGKIWGGEFFTGSYKSFRRAGRLAYVGMPGGDAAAREPWRMAASYLYASGYDITDFSDPVIKRLAAADGEAAGQQRLNTVRRMLETGFNSPQTSGMGRLFDAVSALAGVRNINGFEGQAAMELENAASGGYCGEYSYGVSTGTGIYEVDAGKMIRGVVSDAREGAVPGLISSKFHETIAVLVNDICGRLRADTGLDRVVLSGGVFQNLLLLSKCVVRLEKSGFRVFIHSRVPANDGGISLGQAVIAMARYADFC